MAEQEGIGMDVIEEELVTVTAEQLSKHGFVCIGDSYKMWKIAEYIFGDKDRTFAWHLLDIHNQCCELCKCNLIQIPENIDLLNDEGGETGHTDKAQHSETEHVEVGDITTDCQNDTPGTSSDKEQTNVHSPKAEQSEAGEEIKTEQSPETECSKQEKLEPDGPTNSIVGQDITHNDTADQPHVSSSTHERVSKSRAVRAISKRTTNVKRRFKLPGAKKLHIVEPLVAIKPAVKTERDPGHGTTKFHICEHCGKVFRSTSNLITHRRTHTGEKPYRCKTCGRHFARGDELKIHIRSHTGERPYQCDFCGKMFAKRSGLGEHKRIHTGEKRHVCHVCNKAFTQSRVLKAHRDLKHSDVKKHQCEVCGKAFAVKHGLKRHTYTHGTNTRYECEICGKSYNRRDNLNLHTKTKHGGKVTELVE